MKLQSFAATLLKPSPALSVLPEKGLLDRITKKQQQKTGKQEQKIQYFKSWNGCNVYLQEESSEIKE